MNATTILSIPWYNIAVPKFAETTPPIRPFGLFTKKQTNHTNEVSGTNLHTEHKEITNFIGYPR